MKTLLLFLALQNQCLQHKHNYRTYFTDTVNHKHKAYIDLWAFCKFDAMNLATDSLKKKEPGTALVARRCRKLPG